MWRDKIIVVVKGWRRTFESAWPDRVVGAPGDLRVTSSLTQYALLIRVSPSGFGLSASTSHEADWPCFRGAMACQWIIVGVEVCDCEAGVREGERGRGGG